MGVKCAIQISNDKIFAKALEKSRKFFLLLQVAHSDSVVLYRDSHSAYRTDGDKGEV